MVIANRWAVVLVNGGWEICFSIWINWFLCPVYVQTVHKWEGIRSFSPVMSILYVFRLQVQQSLPLACGWGSTPRPKACLKEKMHRMCFTQVCCFRLMKNNPLYYCLAQLPRFGSLKLHWSVNICLCRCLHPDRSWRTDDGGGFSGMLWCNPGVTLHAGTGLYLFLILFVYLPIRSKSIILTYFMA